MEQSNVASAEFVGEVLKAMGFHCAIRAATPFTREEDQTQYSVWRIETDSESYVLKKTTAEEQTVYETFLRDCDYAPQIYGFAQWQDETYMLMEYVPGETLSRCDRRKLTLALDALICGQKAYWENTSLADVGYSYARAFPKREGWLAYMGGLGDCYRMYLDAFSSVPQTLCNDDLLPFNVIAGADRAVILDWEYAGILPYPCAIARLLAFGEDNPNALFQMTPEDKTFALDYYYENLLKEKGIARAEYERTMQLFFFKEYCEWVYCAAKAGDFTSEYYRKYAPWAQALAQELRYAGA